MNTTYISQTLPQDSIVLIPPSEREIFVLDAKGDVAMEENEDGDEVKKV